MSVRWRGVALILALCCGTAQAEVLTYVIELKGTNEVPPNDSAAHGHADVTFDEATRTLSWKVNYADLTGPLKGMHFHGSTLPGQNAGILVPFKGSLASPISGSAMITEAQATDFLSGKWYINGHTPKYPGGEIRGQVVR